MAKIPKQLPVVPKTGIGWVDALVRAMGEDPTGGLGPTPVGFVPVTPESTPLALLLKGMVERARGFGKGTHQALQKVHVERLPWWKAIMSHIAGGEGHPTTLVAPTSPSYVAAHELGHALSGGPQYRGASPALNRLREHVTRKFYPYPELFESWQEMRSLPFALLGGPGDPPPAPIVKKLEEYLFKKVPEAYEPGGFTFEKRVPFDEDALLNFIQTMELHGPEEVMADTIARSLSKQSRDIGAIRISKGLRHFAPEELKITGFTPESVRDYEALRTAFMEGLAQSKLAGSVNRILALERLRP